MTCQVVGCGRPQNHYNLWKAELIEFHGRVVNCFDALPEEGKWAELAKRVALVAASPFLYLAYSIVYLAGMITDMYWENKHIAEIAEIEKEKIEWLPCPRVIKALGGAEKVKQLPELKVLTANPKQMEHPVMIHFHEGKPAFLFRVFLENGKSGPDDPGYPNHSGSGVIAIAWNPQLQAWTGTNENPLLLMQDLIPKDSLDEKYMAEKIERLVQGKPVGLMERYPGLGLFVPDDKSPYRPDEKTSYLKGAALDEYMKTKTPYYEKEVIPGEEEIVLC